VLRRPPVLDRLVAALAGVDRLVLLGDVVELRQGPASAALEAARPVMEGIGAAMEGREVLLVPGNHDHGLVRPWLDEVPAPPLELRVEPAEASPGAAQLAEMLAPARLAVAYPGVWLRDDVYATHGHYLDVFTTIPTFERIGAGLMGRLVGAPGVPAQPADFEAVLAPIYAWIESAAQRTRPGRRAAGAGRAGSVWAGLSGPGRRPLRARALAAGFPLAIAAINRARLGPVSPDLSGDGLRRGGLAGMREASARLEIGATHLIFGHTHRTGPLPGDDEAEWSTGAMRLYNSGSWIHARAFVGDRGPAGPYWPGGAVEVIDEGPLVVRRLLGDLAESELRPPARA
jgi:hypothetical protein